MNSNKLQHSQDSKIENLVETLCDEDGLKRKEAREQLVDIGESVLKHLKDVIDRKKHICRWEALKVMEEIGSPDSIPVFIEVLEDDKSDIRWIAAEGLIRAGKYAIIPLLKLIVEKHDSVFVLNGVHHVFYELKLKKQLPETFPADKLLSLFKKPDNGARLTVLAHSLLEDME